MVQCPFFLPSAVVAGTFLPRKRSWFNFKVSRPLSLYPSPKMLSGLFFWPCVSLFLSRGQIPCLDRVRDGANKCLRPAPRRTTCCVPDWIVAMDASGCTQLYQSCQRGRSPPRQISWWRFRTHDGGATKWWASMDLDLVTFNHQVHWCRPLQFILHYVSSEVIGIFAEEKSISFCNPCKVVCDVKRPVP